MSGAPAKKSSLATKALTAIVVANLLGVVVYVVRHLGSGNPEAATEAATS